MSIHTSFVPNVTVFCLASGTLLAATPPEGTHAAAGRREHLSHGSAQLGKAVRNPASIANPLPVPVIDPDPHGRFFILQAIPASLPGSPSRWRCVLATGSQGYITHRDFGSSDRDYVLAVQYGQEFEEGGRP